MKLSVGAEFLISQVGNPKEKMALGADLIPAPDESPAPSSGDRVIQLHDGGKVKVQVSYLRKGRVVSP